VLVDYLSLVNVANQCLLEGYSKIIENIPYLQSSGSLVKPIMNIMRLFRQIFMNFWNKIFKDI